MILGKQPPMRRAKSVTEFSAADLAAAAEASDEEGAHRGHERRRQAEPRSVQRLSFSDFEFAGTAQFLRACDLCKRHLGPGLDTFIYRVSVEWPHLMTPPKPRTPCNLEDLKHPAMVEQLLLLKTSSIPL